MDLFPEQPADDAFGFYKFHLVPIHTVYLVKKTEPSLELAAIDYRWLENYLKDNPDSIQSATFNGRKLITAHTDDLQAFVVENKDRFAATFRLQRRAVATE